MKRLVVVGAGGFAREVAWLAREIGEYFIVGHVVSDRTKLGPRDSTVLGDLLWLDSNPSSFDALALGIGTPAARLKVASELANRHPAACWPALIHPSVTFDAESTRFGPGCVVCAGVVATVNVEIESFAVVNLCCSNVHESRVGRGAVVNPGVNISGGVTIGEGVLIGTGAQVLQYLEVHNEATVGAGAVVTRNVGPRTTVVGVPARPLA